MRGSAVIKNSLPVVEPNPYKTIQVDPSNCPEVD
jgi:hypothetical protein